MMESYVNIERRNRYSRECGKKGHAISADSPEPRVPARERGVEHDDLVEVEQDAREVRDEEAGDDRHEDHRHLVL